MPVSVSQRLVRSDREEAQEHVRIKEARSTFTPTIEYALERVYNFRTKRELDKQIAMLRSCLCAQVLCMSGSWPPI